MNTKNIIINKLRRGQILDANKILSSFTNSYTKVPVYLNAAEELVKEGKLLKLDKGKYVYPNSIQNKKIQIERKLKMAIAKGTKVILTGVKTNGEKYKEIVFPHEFQGQNNKKRIVVKKSNGDGYRSYRTDLIYNVINTDS